MRCKRGKLSSKKSTKRGKLYICFVLLKNVLLLFFLKIDEERKKIIMTVLKFTVCQNF